MKCDSTGENAQEACSCVLVNFKPAKKSRDPACCTQPIFLEGWRCEHLTLLGFSLCLRIM